LTLLALDIGGANLKAADGRGYAAARYFPLWQHPEKLAQALSEMLAAAPPHRALAATMTGELADCFATKAEGVAAIVTALREAADGRDVWIYLTDGRFVAAAEAIANPLLAAASNWHALARYAGRHAPRGMGLLIDIGTTTSDIIPLVDGEPRAVGRTDPQRLVAGELVYTGVERSPLCAIVRDLPWRGERCPVAQELFATAWDAYLVLGDLPEEPDRENTADARPATRSCARDRLARAICADRTTFDEADALAAAREVAEAQRKDVAEAIRKVVARLPSPPHAVVVSGRGEFLARRVAEGLRPGVEIVSLSELLGEELSRCATAHALAVLSCEALQPP
jgi:probable H4MPT-linked C1 transfer pathway protein